METQKTELQQHTLKLEHVQEQVLDLQQNMGAARRAFQQTDQATAQVGCVLGEAVRGFSSAGLQLTSRLHLET